MLMTGKTSDHGQRILISYRPYLETDTEISVNQDKVMWYS